MIRSAIAILFLALATPALAESPAGDESYAAGRAIVADIHRIVTPNGIQESFVAALGGTRQAVSVRGSDRANPILLFVHGGPGSVEMPMAWSSEEHPSQLQSLMRLSYAGLCFTKNNH